MKILRLTTLLDFGGQEKQYISFTEKPELLKNEYIFASVGYGGFAENVLKERGFSVKVFNLPVAHKNLKNIFTIAKWLKEIKPDLIHTAASEANFHGVLAAKLAGIPCVVVEEIGVPNNHSIIARQVFRFIYKFANVIIAISENVKNVIAEIKEAPINKIKVIYNPVSQPPSYPKIENKKFQWVFVSRLIARKNVTTLIKAFSKLNPEKRGILHIVGDGVERNVLEKEALELNLENEICFHGFQAEPEKFISQADVFVLPAFDEGFGIVIIEAMLQGKACLCGKGGGIPEYLTDNWNGWFFDPYSVDDLIVTMNHILGLNKQIINEIGEKAYSSVKDKFTIERYVENVEKLYTSLFK